MPKPVHRRHQQRALAIVRTLGAEVEPEFALPQASRFVDGLVIVGPPSDGWGPIADDVRDRLVVLEHFATPPSLAAMLRAIAKHAWLVDMWHQRRGPRVRWRQAGRDHNPPRPPLLLVVAGGTPRSALRSLPALRPRAPGIWCTSAPTGDRLLINPRLLSPSTPGASILRMLLTPRGPIEADNHIAAVLNDPGLLQSTVTHLLEKLMDHTIPTTDDEQRSIVERLLKEGRHIGREEGRRQELLDLVRAHSGDSKAEELAAIDDLDTLRSRVLALVAGDTE